jgi:hypothetical protein
MYEISYKLDLKHVRYLRFISISHGSRLISVFLSSVVRMHKTQVMSSLVNLVGDENNVIIMVHTQVRVHEGVSQPPCGPTIFSERYSTGKSVDNVIVIVAKSAAIPGNNLIGDRLLNLEVASTKNVHIDVKFGDTVSHIFTRSRNEGHLSGGACIIASAKVVNFTRGSEEGIRNIVGCLADYSIGGGNTENHHGTSGRSGSSALAGRRAYVVFIFSLIISIFSLIVIQLARHGLFKVIHSDFGLTSGCNDWVSIDKNVRHGNLVASRVTHDIKTIDTAGDSVIVVVNLVDDVKVAIFTLSETNMFVRGIMVGVLSCNLEENTLEASLQRIAR